MMPAMQGLLGIRDRVVAAVAPVASEEVEASRATGRYLAAAATARVPCPPITCSAMDGFAVRAADVTRPCALPIALAIYAGDASPRPLPPGAAARIFTGAPLPEGADAVVREEAARAEGSTVAFTAAARPGENVRLAGEDVAAGGLALPAGARIGARQAALLAAVGTGAISVFRRPRVAVLATGDEIVAGRTPDSNGAAVAGLVRGIGGEVERRAVGDRLDDVAAALAAALAGADAVITIGGVSVGERDHVPAALVRLGAEVDRGLTGDEAQALGELAEATAHQATDLFTFTSRINERFDMPQKLRMVEQMWRVAYADGHLNEHERHVLWRIADLLHVPQGAYVQARLRAQQQAQAGRHPGDPL